MTTDRSGSSLALASGAFAETLAFVEERRFWGLGRGGLLDYQVATG